MSSLQTRALGQASSDFMAISKASVAEMQGIYGPFTMAERVLQKIWWRQDFLRRDLALVGGQSLEIVSPGRWNLLGGPDFHGARLRINGQIVVGDVEVHFHQRDWHAHRHEQNPAYANVVLHVVLFPPCDEEVPARRHDGGEIATVVLLPWLARALEDYVIDDALEGMTDRDDSQAMLELAHVPPEKLRAQLRALARGRWEQKRATARQRIERVGWTNAAHVTALEILGYRRNRLPMLAVAERWPLERWAAEVDVGAVMESVAERWERHGVRPANQPTTRLRQYREWVQRKPDWPRDLAGWGQSLAKIVVREEEATSVVRRRVQLGQLRADLVERVVGGAVGGNRLQTLICDGFLPLCAAESGHDHFGLWFHWPAGDVPAVIPRLLRNLQVCDGKSHVANQGFAQGMLAWLIRREVFA